MPRSWAMVNSKASTKPAPASPAKSIGTTSRTSTPPPCHPEPMEQRVQCELAHTLPSRDRGRRSHRSREISFIFLLFLFFLFHFSGFLVLFHFFHNLSPLRSPLRFFFVIPSVVFVISTNAERSLGYARDDIRGTRDDREGLSSRLSAAHGEISNYTSLTF